MSYTMSYTVCAYFEKFCKGVVELESNQVSVARSSRDFVLSNIARLSNEGELPSVLEDYCLNFGSFARNTKIWPLDDIDMMICYDGGYGVYDTIKKNELYYIRFADNHPFFDDLRNDDGKTLNSRKVINQLIGALSGVDRYAKAEMHRRGEAATLQLRSYTWTFDIVPCFYTKTGFYLIPDGQGNWKNTDPRIDRSRVLSVNLNHSQIAIPLIRLMKYWKKLKWEDEVSSYMFEQMVLDCLEASPLNANDPLQVRVKQVLQYLWKEIKNPVYDPKGIQGDLNELDQETRDNLSRSALMSYLSADAAIRFERKGEIQNAIKQWQIVFGGKFPYYDE